MVAFNFDIAVKHDTDFSHRFEWRTRSGPVDLSGATFDMRIKHTAADDESVFHLTSSNGRITLEEPNKFSLIIPKYALQPGQYYFGLKYIIGPVHHPLAMGRINARA
ncbi:hypothetical protein FHS85_001956 [Rhodoligotrophos appendicifer]|uniref:hypothetical protein n=1 Tax=Rhodoligotrophos appendicifer TaxID=987056 RepID=UPI001184B89A|nr:hypothetical protein [Rhodoligotrophos appendicifer]